tara:strand:+ start:51144 stop:52358 length:1215 start_codon:yes stop_codon:yes gene_type:complete
MKVLELFAGAGGAALGLEAAGLEHLACVEWDEDACSTMRAAGLPAVQGDVRDLSLYEGMAPDLLWSSFPCQAWSNAGKRKGAQDERNMWPATIEAVDFTGPTWFVGENVVGLTNHKGACKQGKCCVGTPLCPNAYFNQVILGDLRKRFSWVSWKILDSADFGVPQRRRRVFIVAGPRAVEFPERTHANPEKGQGLFDKNLLPWNTVGQALGLTGELSGSRNSTNNPKQERPVSTDEPSPSIGGRGNQMLRIIGGGRNPQSAEFASKRNYRDLTDEPCTTIPAVRIGNAGPWVVAGSRPELLDRPAPTVTTTEVKGTRGKHMGKLLANGKRSGGVDRASDAVWLATGRRRLTVAECARLMDLPDEYPLKGTKTSQYRQVGNAVTPIVAQRIAEQITKAEKENDDA